MRTVSPYIEIIDMKPQDEILRKLERIGRVCYKSEERIKEGSAEQFVRKLLALGHESVIEHESVTVSVVCDRGISHEIVRHRIASYSQESSRYCNYSSGRFGGEVSTIDPLFFEEGSRAREIWEKTCKLCEFAYFDLLNEGCSPQEARSVLPHSLKTEIVITMNLREWRHFFRLRTAPSAHPQMREIAGMLLEEIRTSLPVFFDDIGTNT